MPIFSTMNPDYTVFWSMQNFASIPEDVDWLSLPEQNRYQQFRFPKRQNEWLLGRWTAKNLLSNLMKNVENPSSKEFSIQNEDSGAPYAMWNDQRLSGSLSISHRGENAVAAFCFNPDIKIGIDLEEVEAKSHAFVEDYFTELEASVVLALPIQEQALAASLLWSGREAIVKALQIGLRIDTRQIALNLPALNSHENWQPVEIRRCATEGINLKLFWQKLNHTLVTLAIKHNHQEDDFSPDWIQQIL